MEQEYDVMKIDNIIFNYQKRPSNKSVIVGIPMFVYRIQTNSFRSGLNFFEKAVLKFKSKPGFPNDQIAQYLGIDSKLIDVIQASLVSEKLIGSDGLLTEMGKAQRMLLDGLIVDESKKKIGYVFRYLDEDKYFPYYVQEYRTPNITSDAEPRINGVKGDDFSYKVLYAKEIIAKQYNTLPPSEQKLLALIRNKSNQDEEFYHSFANEPELSIKFIPDSEPQLVWVCAYAYLKDMGNETFASDWDVLDPFSHDPQDNVSLKLHIRHSAPELSRKIDEAFADVKTIEKKIFMEAHFQMDRQIESTIIKDFPLPNKVGNKLYSYLQTIVRTKISQEYLNYGDEARAREFSTALNGLFESLLKEHRARYPKEYSKMLSEFAAGEDKVEDVAKRGLVLKEIFRFLYKKKVPSGIFNAAGGSLHSPSAMRGHLAATILTKMYTDQFYMLVLKYHEELNEICQMRNDRGHGHIDSEGVDERLTKEQVERYYDFLRSFIYEYTNL